MKLSVVIICWNDRKVIEGCLRSIVEQTSEISYEIIVSDNGSTDDSLAFIRESFKSVKIIENRANLGFARGNNAGIAHATGEYVLILNPDTIIMDHALDRWIAFADSHPSVGAFGCRVLNPDFTYQNPARPIPTVRGYLVAALYLRGLAKVSSHFESDIYPDWKGETERTIGFQSGCCLLVRRRLLASLEGFDERFFYHFEESDLCARVWQSGSSILFYPDAAIVHLGGQSVGRFPIRFALETFRSCYRYFHKHYGRKGAIRIRWVNMLSLSLRYLGYGLRGVFGLSESIERRLEMYRVLLRWNYHLDPIEFVTDGKEPEVGFQPLMPAVKQVLNEAVH